MTKNSRPSSSKAESLSFDLLDERIQRWIWQKGWEELKDAQEKAIPIILDGSRDVVISSATASGKTEAAFFPILTRFLSVIQNDPCVVYISPLKALINDQWDRLEQLCESLHVPIVPWHGDASLAQKKRFLKNRCGCLLITPESLESLLIHYGSSLGSVFDKLLYIVIDELHAFIDSDRGKQLQSQLHRIETAIKRRVPRIGLSATLGEMRLAAEFLRPGQRDAVAIIEGRDSGQELKVIVKGYRDSPCESDNPETHGSDKSTLPISSDESTLAGEFGICRDLFSTLRGSNNLVFPNSRSKVEFYADQLRIACEKLGIPNEFWAHHGNLSKEIREEAERTIKASNRPTTIVATTTLELGIDIGAVKSVAQVGAAPSVASLRQRLGRSGRRKGEPAILRCYCLEAEVDDNSPLSDLLYEGLLQNIAQIRLLVKGWYEPPRIQSLHLSTLIQQLLSAIAQYGGLNAELAWTLLCDSGVFPQINKQEFLELLRGLGAKRVIFQDNTGLLLLDSLGERLVNNYTFYAAFVSEREFRIVCGEKTLGTLPLSRPVDSGSYLIFAGHRWKVLTCSPDKQTIEVEPSRGGKPPVFDGMGCKVHDLVREEMRVILAGSDPVAFLDKTAMSMLFDARAAYVRLGLGKRNVLPKGSDVYLVTWKGDWINDALALMLRRKAFNATNEGLAIVLSNTDLRSVADALREIGSERMPSPEEISAKVDNKQRGKWDWLLTENLLSKSFASNELDIEGAQRIAQEICAPKQ